MGAAPTQPGTPGTTTNTIHNPTQSVAIGAIGLNFYQPPAAAAQHQHQAPGLPNAAADSYTPSQAPIPYPQ